MTNNEHDITKDIFKCDLDCKKCQKIYDTDNESSFDSDDTDIQIVTDRDIYYNKIDDLFLLCLKYKSFMDYDDLCKLMDIYNDHVLSQKINNDSKSPL